MKKSILFMCCCLLAACAKQAPPVSAPSDFVVATLGEAAEQVHSELAMLAKLRGQGLQPLLPPPDPSLEKPVSVSWTGPAAGALKEICLQTGKEIQIPASKAVKFTSGKALKESL